MLKKIFTGICVASLTLGLFACSSSNSADSDSGDDEITESSSSDRDNGSENDKGEDGEKADGSSGSNASSSGSTKEGEEGSSSGNEKNDGNSESSSSFARSSSSVEEVDGTIYQSAKGTFWDRTTNRTYGTLVVGPYTWLTENLKDKPNVINSICYGGDSKNCDKYGRLYRRTHTEDLCPLGFRLPYENEWKFLYQNIKQDEETRKFLNVQLGGSCSSEKECSGLDSIGRYISIDGKAINFSQKHYSTDFFDDQTYYSIRCVKFTGITDTYADLPECDSIMRRREDAIIFVISTGNSLTCTEKGWRYFNSISSSNNYNYCLSEGTLYYSDTTLYACRGKGWREAKAFDILRCDSTTKDSVLKVNQYTEICRDGYWQDIPGLDQEFGICNKSIYGKIIEYNGNHYQCDSSGWDLLNEWLFKSSSSQNTTTINSSASAKSSSSTTKTSSSSANASKGICNKTILNTVVTEGSTEYKCGSYGWQITEAMDYKIGYCIDSSLYKMATYKDTLYKCGFSSATSTDFRWMPLSDLDRTLDTCTKDLEGTVKEDDQGTSYICKAMSWVKATITEVLGTCGNTLKKGIFNGQEAVCDTTRDSQAAWYILQPIDSVAGYCRTAILKTAIIFENKYYQCHSSSYSTTSRTIMEWRTVKVTEAMGECTAEREGEIFQNDLNKSKCINKEWIGIPSDSFKDARDGNVYKIQTIGKQTWMMENLRYIGKDVDKYWYYMDSETYKEKGPLYKWHTAMKVAAENDSANVDAIQDNVKAWQGICPDGWRIPTSSDRNELNDSLRKRTLKPSVYGFIDSDPGYRYEYFRNGIDLTTGYHTNSHSYVWILSTASEVNPYYGVATRGYVNDYYSLDRKPNNAMDYDDLALKTFAHHVRCIKNN